MGPLLDCVYATTGRTVSIENRFRAQKCDRAIIITGAVIFILSTILHILLYKNVIPATGILTLKNMKIAIRISLYPLLFVAFSNIFSGFLKECGLLESEPLWEGLNRYV